MVVVNEPLVQLRGKRMVQAGELVVPRNEPLTPNRLRRLAEQEWSIVSSRPTKGGGFALLLQREIVEEEEQEDPPSGFHYHTASDYVASYWCADPRCGAKADTNIEVEHKGTARCPNYCDCVSNAVIAAILEEVDGE